LTPNEICFDADDYNDDKGVRKELLFPKISTTQFRRVKKSAVVKISAVLENKVKGEDPSALLGSAQKPYNLLEKNENGLLQSFNCFLCEPVAFE
jgi:hypothetical protein